MLRTKMGTQRTIIQQTNHEERNQTSKKNVKVPEACNNQSAPCVRDNPFSKVELERAYLH
jgi:hypothetical protein